MTGEHERVRRAPQEAEPGASFLVGTDIEVTRAVLMRPGSITHSFDMSQRHIELAIRRTTEGVRVRAPAETVAIPGWYMLFVLSPAGVPSVARWIRVGNGR